MFGIDYSDFSIKLASRIKQDLDVESAERITFRFENAFDLIDEGRFDIIHDKGTFDVVYMNKELENHEYAKAIHFRLSKNNPQAVFILTSCNLTSSEMDTIFAAEGLFKKLCEIKGYRSFTFGGVTG
jgi:ABC-type amino acid transport substrate-binding protein